MGLKLAGEETEQQSGNGLRLSGQEADARKTGDVNVEPQNPWDLPDRPVVMSSVRSTVETETFQAKSGNEGNIVLVIGKIVVYLCFIFEMVSGVWICMQKPYNVAMNLMKFTGMYSFFEVLCIIDAILVNVLYERKLSLVFWAWLLPFFYPAKRNTHIKGDSGIGKMLGLGVFIASVALGIFLIKAFMGYGGIIAITDEETRLTAAEVMDQVTDEGTRLGDKLMRSVIVETAAVDKQGSGVTVVFVGNGSVKMDGDVFVDIGTSTIETQLAFVKSSEGKYELQVVVLDGTTLTPYGAKAYWNAVVLGK